MKIADVIKSGMCRTRVGIARPSPSLFFYPGLNTQPVHSKGFDDIIDVLKSNFHVIKDEYMNYKDIRSNDYNTANDEHKLHSGDWHWNSYILKGKRQVEFAIHCPKTVELLESFTSPKLMTNIPFSYAFFSTLKQHSHINPHYGPCNLRIRCHFPLIIPPSDDLGMKIGNDIIRWKENEPLFFDDTYEHSVWNNTDSDRVVLLFDMWHPDLHPDEIEAIENMFDYARQQGWMSSSSSSGNSNNNSQ